MEEMVRAEEIHREEDTRGGVGGGADHDDDKEATEELVRAREIHREGDTQGGAGRSAPPRGAPQLSPLTRSPRPRPGRPRTLPHRAGRARCRTAASCAIAPAPAGPGRATAAHQAPPVAPRQTVRPPPRAWRGRRDHLPPPGLAVQPSLPPTPSVARRRPARPLSWRQRPSPRCHQEATCGRRNGVGRDARVAAALLLRGAQLRCGQPTLPLCTRHHDPPMGTFGRK